MLTRDLFFSLLATMALAFVTGPGPWALFLCFPQSCYGFACLEGFYRSLATWFLCVFAFFFFLRFFAFCFFFTFRGYQDTHQSLLGPVDFCFCFCLLFFFVLCVDQDTPSVFIARRSRLMFLFYWSSLLVPDP